MKLDRPVLRPPHCYLTRAAYEVGTLYDDTTILTSYTNEGQSNLTKSDIARLIMTSGRWPRSCVVSITFARWQHASRSWSWGCIWDPHLGEVEVVVGQRERWWFPSYRLSVVTIAISLMFGRS